MWMLEAVQEKLVKDFLDMKRNKETSSASNYPSRDNENDFGIGDKQEEEEKEKFPDFELSSEDSISGPLRPNTSRAVHENTSVMKGVMAKYAPGAAETRLQANFRKYNGLYKTRFNVTAIKPSEFITRHKHTTRRKPSAREHSIVPEEASDFSSAEVNETPGPETVRVPATGMSCVSLNSSVQLTVHRPFVPQHEIAGRMLPTIPGINSQRNSMTYLKNMPAPGRRMSQSVVMRSRRGKNSSRTQKSGEETPRDNRSPVRPHRLGLYLSNDAGSEMMLGETPKFPERYTNPNPNT